MNSNKIKFFIENTIKNSPLYLDHLPILIIEKDYQTKKDYINNFLSPLVFNYNNSNLKIPLFIGGVPILKKLNYLASVIEIDKIEKMISLMK